MRQKAYGKFAVLWLLSILLVGLTSEPAQAKTKIRVFIFSGQSNSVGYQGTNDATLNAASLPDSLKAAQPNIKLLGACSDFYPPVVCSAPGSTGDCGTPPTDKYVVTGYGWQPLRPKWFPNICAGCQVGAYISFGHNMQKAFPADSFAVIVIGGAPSSMADQGLDGGFWLPPSAGGPKTTGALRLFMNTVLGIRNALSNLKLTYDTEIAGICWLQGESDCSDQTSANSYKASLTAFIKDIRDSLGVPNLPFVISMISTYYGWQYNSIVRKAETDVAASVANVGIFDTKDVTTTAVFEATGGHYDALGQVKIGNGEFVQMRQLLNSTSAVYSPRRQSAGFNLIGFKVIPKRKLTLVISDLQGRTISSYHASVGQTIDLARTPGNAFAVTIKSESGIETGRLILPFGHTFR